MVDRSAPNLPRIVIAGGGFGGLAAARCLKNAAAHITVVDRNNHHLFQPLLYQVATAGLSPAQIAAPIRAILRKQKNAEVLMSEVKGVDQKQRAVLLSDRSLFFDYLIIATGARHSYFGHDEWERHAPGLKTLSDAIRIRQKILLAFERAEMEPEGNARRATLTFVIVGGGPTGVELAGAIAELARRALASDFRHIDTTATRILLLEAGKRILPSFPEELSDKAAAALSRLGVEVRTGSSVERIENDGLWVSDNFLAAGTIIWAAGIIASPVGLWLSHKTDPQGRVFVNSDLSLPSDPNIFVIGDAAYFAPSDGKPLPALAPVAMQEGKYVAHLILSRLKGQNTPPFRYKDKGSLATVGRSFAITVYKRLKVSGFVAWLVWLAVHIYYLIGFRNRLIVIFEWAWAYFTYQRGARLITQTMNKGKNGE
ncbi:MAG: NAD(P)/FAD-dependent oxidoreductase [Deltaproteobacteria bacterium]|nr:NAD(P)/FAD-dependent oxidoreductase [Deltaproteobacteria bacterium]